MYKQKGYFPKPEIASLILISRIRLFNDQPVTAPASDLKSINFAPADQKIRMVKGSSGKVNFRIEFPVVKFGDCKGTLTTGGDEKNKWIDFVIYSGIEKEFNFDKIEEAIIGFLVTLKNGPITPEKQVIVSQSGDHLQLTWQNLHVKANVKPYAERATLVLK